MCRLPTGSPRPGDVASFVCHGAASHDKFCNLRTLPEIQKRGQWATSSSVARYEKHSKLLRQLHRLSASRQV